MLSEALLIIILILLIVLLILSLRTPRIESSIHEAIRQTDQLRAQITGIYANSSKRGAIGEAVLMNLLSDILPQDRIGKHTFNDGTIADCAILLNDTRIIIDSKFPLENKDPKTLVSSLKERIKEAAKYHKPAEGTFPYIFLYIPSQGIRDDVYQHQELLTYARERAIIITGPHDLPTHLELALLMIRTQSAHQDTRRLLDELSAYRTHAAAIDEIAKTLSKHMANAQSKLIELSTQSARISQRSGAYDKER